MTPITEYFIALRDQDGKWHIGDVPFAYLQAESMAKGYCDAGYTVRIVQSLKTVVRELQPDSEPFDPDAHLKLVA